MHSFQGPRGDMVGPAARMALPAGKFAGPLARAIARPRLATSTCSSRIRRESGSNMRHTRLNAADQSWTPFQVDLAQRSRLTPPIQLKSGRIVVQTGYFAEGKARMGRGDGEVRDHHLHE